VSTSDHDYCGRLLESCSLLGEANLKVAALRAELAEALQEIARLKPSRGHEHVEDFYEEDAPAPAETPPTPEPSGECSCWDCQRCRNECTDENDNCSLCGKPMPKGGCG